MCTKSWYGGLRVKLGPRPKNDLFFMMIFYRCHFWHKCAFFPSMGGVGSTKYAQKYTSPTWLFSAIFDTYRAMSFSCLTFQNHSHNLHHAENWHCQNMSVHGLQKYLAEIRWHAKFAQKIKHAFHNFTKNMRQIWNRCSGFWPIFSVLVTESQNVHSRITVHICVVERFEMRRYWIVCLSLRGTDQNPAFYDIKKSQWQNIFATIQNLDFDQKLSCRFCIKNGQSQISHTRSLWNILMQFFTQNSHCDNDFHLFYIKNLSCTNWSI